MIQYSAMLIAHSSHDAGIRWS